MSHAGPALELVPLEKSSRERSRVTPANIQTRGLGMSTTLFFAKWYSAKHQSFFRSSSGAPFVDHSKILVFDITRINTRACSSQSICWKPTPRQRFFSRCPRDPRHSNISAADPSSSGLSRRAFVWKCFMMSRACFTSKSSILTSSTLNFQTFRRLRH